MRGWVIGILGLLAATASAAPVRPAAEDPRAQAATESELGRAAFARGDDAEALKRFEGAFVLFPSPTILLNVAEVHVRRGETDKASEAFNHYLKLAGNDPAQAELVQHVRLRLVDLHRGVHALDEDDGPVGPDEVRTTKAPARAPYVAPIDDSLRAPVVDPIEDHVAPRYEPYRPMPLPPLTPAPAPKPKRVLAPWETGLVALGVVGGLVLTFAPLVYYTAPSLPNNNPVFTGGFGQALR